MAADTFDSLRYDTSKGFSISKGPITGIVKLVPLLPLVTVIFVRSRKRIIKEKLYQSYSMKTSAFAHLSPLRKAKASCLLGNQHHYI